MTAFDWREARFLKFIYFRRKFNRAECHLPGNRIADHVDGEFPGLLYIHKGILFNAFRTFSAQAEHQYRRYGTHGIEIAEWSQVSDPATIDGTYQSNWPWYYGAKHELMKVFPGSVVRPDLFH